MTVALAMNLLGFDRAPTIIAAQAVTVVGAPLIAGVLLWLTSRRDVMGEHVNGPVTKAFAGLGFVMLLAMAGKTAFVDLPANVAKYRAKSQEVSVPEPAVEQSAVPAEAEPEASTAEASQSN